MGDVIGVNFGNKPEEETTTTGEARCLQCGHEWIAVAPLGITALECPECKTHMGVYKHYVHPNEEVFVCNCGGDLFFVKRGSVQCYKCGLEPDLGE